MLALMTMNMNQLFSGLHVCVCVFMCDSAPRLPGAQGPHGCCCEPKCFYDWPAKCDGGARQVVGEMYPAEREKWFGIGDGKLPQPD